MATTEDSTHPTGMHSCYRPKRSFGQGNIFRSMCHSVHREGGGGLVPGGGVSNFSGGVSNFSGGFLQFFGERFLQFFWGGGFLQIFRGSPIFRGGGLHQNTVTVRPVRILLECILVGSIVTIVITTLVDENRGLNAQVTFGRRFTVYGLMLSSEVGRLPLVSSFVVERTGYHTFTVTTNASQQVEFFHS